MCLMCDGSPVDGDKRQGREFSWKVGLMDACCAEPCFCLCTVFPVTAPCMVYFLRKETLGDEDLSKYKCCQGYYDCCCFEGGKCCEEACPCLCLSLESTFCCCCATQATRFYAMDLFELQPDACDNRLIRCQNCLQGAACLTWCLGCIIGSDSIKKCGRYFLIIADCVTISLLGCMAAQVKHEVWERGHGAAPTSAVMTRDVQLVQTNDQGKAAPDKGQVKGNQLVTT